MGVFDGEAAVFVYGEGTEPAVTGADQMLRFGVDGKIFLGAGKHIPIRTERGPLLGCDGNVVAAHEPVNEDPGKTGSEEPHCDPIQVQLHNGFQKASANPGPIEKPNGFGGAIHDYTPKTTRRRVVTPTPTIMSLPIVPAFFSWKGVMKAAAVIRSRMEST